MAKYLNEGCAVATKPETLHEEALVLFKGGKKQEPEVWVVDSGASSYMAWETCVSRYYKEFDAPENV